MMETQSPGTPLSSIPPQTPPSPYPSVPLACGGVRRSISNFLERKIHSLPSPALSYTKPEPMPIVERVYFIKSRKKKIKMKASKPRLQQPRWKQLGKCLYEGLRKVISALEVAAQVDIDLICPILGIANYSLETPVTKENIKELQEEVKRLRKEALLLASERDELSCDITNLHNDLCTLEDDRESAELELSALRDAANAVKVRTPSYLESPLNAPFENWANQIGNPERCPHCNEHMIDSKWCPITGARHRSEAEIEVDCLRRRLSAIAMEELSKGFIADGSYIFHGDDSCDSENPSPRRLSRALVDSALLDTVTSLHSNSPLRSAKHLDPYDQNDVIIDSDDTDDPPLLKRFNKPSRGFALRERDRQDSLSSRSRDGESPVPGILGKVGCSTPTTTSSESPNLNVLNRAPTFAQAIAESPLPVAEASGLTRQSTIPSLGLERIPTAAQLTGCLSRHDTFPLDFAYDKTAGLTRQPTMPTGEAASSSLSRQDTFPVTDHQSSTDNILSNINLQDVMPVAVPSQSVQSEGTESDGSTDPPLPKGLSRVDTLRQEGAAS